MKEQTRLEAGQKDRIQLGLPQFARLSEVVSIQNPAAERLSHTGNIAANMSSGTRARSIMTPLIGPRVLDFGRPFQARKWLRLLQEEPGSGIRIRPNLDLGRNALGFSFNSNHLGLRGPCSSNGKAVVLGTSFAMGFAVDQGRDWFSDLLAPSAWFNAGLPVGPEEWATLLKLHFGGARDLALLLYHPNVWQVAVGYTKWRSSGQGLFQFFGWRTGFWDCLRLHQRKVSQQKMMHNQGKRLMVKQSGKMWRLDATYSVMSLTRDAQILNRAATRLADLLSTFEQVICLRLPIKEQLIPDRNLNEHFHLAHHSYDEAWQFTQDTLGRVANILFVEPEGFQLDHFHSFDTHLNEEGNRHLRFVIHRQLAQNGMKHLLCD